jgi:hypothetical protein
MSKGTEIINLFGKVIGWNDVSIVVFGRKLEGVTAVEYSDEDEIEGIKGAGAFDVGYGEGNSSAKFSFTISEEERRAMIASIPKGKRIQDSAASPVVISYDYGGVVYTDRVNNVKIKNNGVSVKQGDKSVAFKFDCYTSNINYNI